MGSESVEILIMGDNNLETVGGEQESTKIILSGLKNRYKFGEIQPGPLDKKEEGIRYFDLTNQTRIKHLIKNPFSFLKYMLDVKKIIKQYEPKIIHTQGQVSFFIVSLLKKYKMISRKITLFHTERGLYTKYNSFFKRIFLYCMTELDTLVTTTQFNLKYWREALTNKGIEVDYKVIPNTAGEIFENYVNELEVNKPKEFSIGFSGRYTEWKNWPLAVEIVKKTYEELGKNLRVYMTVGCLDKESENKTKKMFNELHDLMGEKFEGKININLVEMNKFYYNLDVFILTSKYNTESFGRTLVEAMSRKTAVLTTNAGGSVEVVGNEENVLESSEEFKNKIIYYHNNPAELKSAKEQNLKRVKEKYSLENNISKHEDLYRLKLK